MGRDGGTKEKGTCVSKDLKKEVSAETGPSWDSSEIPHALRCFGTLRQGPLYCRGLSTESVALMSFRTERDSSPTWRKVSSSQLGGRIGKSPWSSLEPHR